MDLLVSIVGSVLVETGRAMCSQVAGIIRFRSNVSSLETELSSLMELRGKVQRELEILEVGGRSLQVQLRKWLRDVREIEPEANSMQEQRISFKASKELARVLDEIKRLKKVGEWLIDIFSMDGPSKRVEHVPGPLIQDQTTASHMLVKITSSLRREEVQKIGVWGMGGVGKTTLVRALNNKLRREAATQPFGLVIWATVSKDFDLRRVQKQIAERLDIETGMEDSEVRLAGRIYQRLEKERNFLIILDDVWEDINLDLLGVPPMKEHQGSKVILTSRSLEICRSMRTDFDIRVECLCEEEAWQLFCHNAGEVARSDRIRPFAKAVAHECRGLPLAIITTGTAMRGKKIKKLWKHALKELRRSVPYVKSIEENIYKSLRLSYDSLGGNLRSCFLYCSLFPEDHSIDVNELVRCWMAEGFIDERNNHVQLMNEGINLIESLKDCCLLEEGVRDDTVKMHDVVRDFAIWIMSTPSEDECHSLVMSGTGLQEISQDKFVPSVQRVSLMNNKLKELRDCPMKRLRTSTLMLQGNFRLHEIPSAFMLAFPGLRVLNLSGTCIRSLPDSLCQLHDLCSLILRDCYYLLELPSLEALVKLQLLDLCATHISELPRGLEALSSLRLLDLSRTHYLESIPSGIVSQLLSLEILDMTLSHYHWNVCGQAEEGQATFEEIGCLRRLLVLSIRLICVPSISPENEAWMKRLKKFQLFIGPTANSLPMKHDKRRVTISSLNVSEVWIGWLLANATSLVLNHCWGVNEMLENLVIDITSSFEGFRSLTIESFGSSLRPAGGCAAQVDLLPNLEELHLRYVRLESTRELVGYLGLRFETLKLIEISRCPRLRCLLSVGNFIRFLPKLEEIRVSFCDTLQELFNYSPGLLQASAVETVVPSLRVMKLRNLPQLRRLCGEGETWGCLEKVEVKKCNLLRNLPTSSESAHRIKEIRGESHWWNNLSWEYSTTKTNLQPRFIPT